MKRRYRVRAYTLRDSSKGDILLLSLGNSSLTFGEAFGIRYNGDFKSTWNMNVFDEVKADKVLIKNIKYKKTTMGKLRDIIMEVQISKLLSQLDNPNLAADEVRIDTIPFFEEMDTLILKIDKHNKNSNILIFVNVREAKNVVKKMNVITIITEDFKIIKFHFHHTNDDNYLDKFMNGDKSSDLELKLK